MEHDAGGERPDAGGTELDAGLPDGGRQDGGADAGADGGRPGAGTPDAGPPDAGCVSTAATELSCEDRNDGDCDGLIDCEDPDCTLRACSCPDGGCPETVWSACLDPADAGVLDGGADAGGVADGGPCQGFQVRQVPRCLPGGACGPIREQRGCGLTGIPCGATAFGACSRPVTTACTGVQTRQVGTCQSGACTEFTPQTRACNMPVGTQCGSSVCCGAGVASYDRCFNVGTPGPKCGSELFDQLCNGSGACALNVCNRVVCWGTGCGTGGEVGSVPCPL